MTTDQFPKSKYLYEQLVELIEGKIIGGEYRLGDQLPTENDLAVQYRVSRTVIREAMKTLQQKGWVETRVGRGTFIVNNIASGVGTSFDALVRMNPDQAFEHLIQVRELIEPQIAALAAQSASDEQLAAMRATVEAMEAAIRRPDGMEDFLDGDYNFHQQMAESTGNPLVPTIIRPVVTLMRDQQKYHLYKVKGGGLKSQENHRRIMEALEQRDPAGARRCMLEHIRQVRIDVQNAEKE